MDDSHIRSKTALFSFENGLVWTGPKRFRILVNYTFHTRCISKSSAILIIHLTFHPQQKGGKLLIKHNMHITTLDSNEGLQKCC